MTKKPHRDVSKSKTHLASRPQRRVRSLWEERYGHLPRFLHYFVIQNWFKKLFPIFTLEVRRLGDARAWGGGEEKAGASLHAEWSWGWAGLQQVFPQAYPEMGTIEGLASTFVDFLPQASWAERVSILNALMRLFPDISNELRSRLQAKLLYLLNQDQPPSLQVSPPPQDLVSSPTSIINHSSLVPTHS